MTLDRAPLFVSTGKNIWRPSPFAAGPFAGLQGGGVAGLLCAVIEAEAGKEKLGVPASLATHFLRPAPAEQLKTSVRVLKTGRRASFLEAEATSNGKTIAIQRATIMREVALPFELTFGLENVAKPQTLPKRPHDRIHKPEWMWTAMDVRQDQKEKVWFKLLRPLCQGASAYAAALPAADWAHGLTLPLGVSRRQAAMIPNTDLVVHFIHEPHGDWIGLDPVTRWDRTGLGLGWAELRDVHGVFGRVSMSVAVSPVESG